MTNNNARTKPGAPRGALEGRLIERGGMQTFIEVGNALLEIRDQRLYREHGYKTFDDYCRERWNWSKTHVNRQIQAAQVSQNLTPMGVTPLSERQARELVSLPPEEQREVAATLDLTTATAAEVRVVVKKRRAAKVDAPAKVAQSRRQPEEHFDADLAYQTIEAMIESCPKKHLANFMRRLYHATEPNVWQWLKPGDVLIANNQSAFIANVGRRREKASNAKWPFGAGELIMAAVECLISELSIQQRAELRKKEW